MIEKDSTNVEEVLVLGSEEQGFPELNMDQIEQKCQLDPEFFAMRSTRSEPFTLNLGFKYPPGNQQAAIQGFSADRKLKLRCGETNTANQDMDLVPKLIVFQRPESSGYAMYEKEEEQWKRLVEDTSSEITMTSAQIDQELSYAKLTYVAFKSVPFTDAQVAEEGQTPASVTSLSPLARFMAQNPSRR